MSLLTSIFEKQKVFDVDGTEFPLRAHTSLEQCMFLQEIITELKPKGGIEVGLGYGISTLAILEAFSKYSDSFKHAVIDPFQDDWYGIGLKHIKDAGFEKNVIFYNNFSDEVLPKLYYEGFRAQFAYIDSTKIFDILLVDVYFIHKMLDIGGVVIFDDVNFPGIKKLMRYLVQHPSFRIYKTFKKEKISSRKRMAQSLYKKLFNSLPFKKDLIPALDNRSDEDLNVSYYCMALQKKSEDIRNWDWSVNF